MSRSRVECLMSYNRKEREKNVMEINWNKKKINQKIGRGEKSKQNKIKKIGEGNSFYLFEKENYFLKNELSRK